LESGIGTTTAVGAYSDKGGDSPCGAADMAGNVWEWTSTRWGTERSQPQYAPPYDPGDGRENLTRDEPFREYRIVRGGSYQNGADRATCTARGRDAANKGDRRRGFRVAIDI
jgi:iron(II)-dependent oxidoreductase